MAPALGELVGRGVSSDVHEWTSGTVAKLFKPGFDGLAPVEYERTCRIHAAGAPCPRVHGMIEVDGRPGIVFDRLDGPSMLADRDAASLLAHVHVALHELAAPDLPQLSATLASRGIAGTATGSSLFHGDLHPGNVLRHGATWCVIDWSNAHVAPAAADVACSVLSIGYRGAWAPDHAVDVHRRRVRAADRYLDEYRSLRPEVAADVAGWAAVIGRLLLAQEPDLAFADDLRDRWLDGS